MIARDDRKRLTRDEWDTHTLEQKEQNAKRRRRGWVTDFPCHICGLPVSDNALKNAWHVRMTVDGDLVAHDVELDEREDQGYFPIGASCAKTLPRQFRIKFTQLTNDEGRDK